MRAEAPPPVHEEKEETKMCTHMGGTSAMSAASNPTVTAQYTTADKTVEQVAPETIIRKSTYRTGVYAVTAADGAGITIKELRGSRTGSANDSNSAPEYAYQTNVVISPCMTLIFIRILYHNSV